MNQINLKMNPSLLKPEPLRYYLLALTKYVTFNGRSRRKEFWYFTSINTILILTLFAIRLILVENTTQIIDIVMTLFCLVIIIPTIAVGIRRLNDIGLNKWLILINLLPVLGNLIFLVFMLTDSQIGYNKHGEYPKFSPIFF